MHAHTTNLARSIVRDAPVLGTQRSHGESPQATTYNLAAVPDDSSNLKNIQTKTLHTKFCVMPVSMQ